MTATKRPYTGLKEGYAKGRRPGLEHFANGLEWITGGRLWNNGTYGIRPNKSNATIPSVHSTGRAADISKRATFNHPGSDRLYMEKWIDLLTQYADELGLEMIIDYGYQGGLGGGRVWMCDRNGWADAPKGAIASGGEPWADWIHVELDPKHADDAALVQKAFDLMLPKAPKKTAASKKP